MQVWGLTAGDVVATVANSGTEFLSGIGPIALSSQNGEITI